ncbi:MAG: hypothetical protein FNT15_09435 [Sulfurovum sp.]|nr:MAG: hypothetical protein FNT15_09435 [Sulfurovum sp.]
MNFLHDPFYQFIIASIIAIIAIMITLFQKKSKFGQFAKTSGKDSGITQITDENSAELKAETQGNCSPIAQIKK